MLSACISYMFKSHHLAYKHSLTLNYLQYCSRVNKVEVHLLRGPKDNCGILMLSQVACNCGTAIWSQVAREAQDL